MLKPNDFETWRNKRNMSQEEAATYIGISRRAWQKYEYGTSKPTLCVMLAMAARDNGLGFESIILPVPVQKD